MEQQALVAPYKLHLRAPVQAADYLDDPETLTQASEALAGVLFPASLPAMPPAGKNPARLHDKRGGAAGGVRNRCTRVRPVWDRTGARRHS